ncbi:MAG: AAA family ATPase [Alistipes sp.]|nr:AAA family ATPase [Alistipes sp.]
MPTNPQIDLAHDFLACTGENIFLTGRAGTGKTTFLHELRKRSPKRMVVVAPTGIAAINAGGVTMHSFFQLPFGIFIPGSTREGGEVRRFSKAKIAIIKSIDLLVIDEISMVRADLLDSVDDVLRRFRDRSRPFGGVQLLMIGDMQQLAPVVRDEEWALLRDYYASPYFFDSVALRRTSYTSIELQHIYRQSDTHFIDLLARVRDNRVDEQTLQALNERHCPDFDPPQSEGYITLTSHNHTARRINDDKLAVLSTPEYLFRAEIEGDFPEYLYPVEAELRLKEGAQVMFSKNDPSPEKRFMNGTIGTVTRLEDELIEVQPAAGGEPIVVEMAEWLNTKYAIDTATSSITEQTDGIFRQYPLRTAWAITIHKSQGLTFDRAIIDAADSFSHGQVYVALSRCRTLEGMVLRTPLRRGAIISDDTVDRFSRDVADNQPDDQTLSAFRKQYHESLLGELFDFEPLWRSWRAAGAYMEEGLAQLYPRLVERWHEAGGTLSSEVAIGVRFRGQIARLMTDDYASDPVLAERVRKGADYFLERCAPLALLLSEAAASPVDNKEVKKRVGSLLERVGKELRVKLSTLAAMQQAPFSVQAYLEVKGAAVAEVESGAGSRGKSKVDRKVSAGGTMGSAEGRAAGSDEDILDPELFELLRAWRNALAREQGVSAFVIATQKALIGIANTRPSTVEQLAAIKGIGKVFIAKYGSAVLGIVADYGLGEGI